MPHHARSVVYYTAPMADESVGRVGYWVIGESVRLLALQGSGDLSVITVTHMGMGGPPSMPVVGPKPLSTPVGV